MTAKQGVNKDGVNSGVNTKTRCGHWCGQQNDSAKHYSAVNYAAKTGFLVRKEMVRSEVRSESMKMDRGGMITLGNHWMRPRPSLFSVSPK